MNYYSSDSIEHQLEPNQSDGDRRAAWRVANFAITLTGLGFSVHKATEHLIEVSIKMLVKTKQFHSYAE